MRTGRKTLLYEDIEAGNGALGKIRTPDPQIRSLVLYPAELRARCRGPVNISRGPKDGET